MKHVIIDTDFGGDPDDILCLFYALRSPEVKIHAIITNDEYNGNYRAKALAKWLNEAGISIPVFSGKDLGNRNLFFLQKFSLDIEAIESLYATKNFSPILEEVAKHNGSYVSIGGLSNVHYLLTTMNHLLQYLTLYIMGGAIHYRKPGRAEHNIRIDIDAAKAIFTSGLQTKWILSDQTSVPELKISRNHQLYNFISQQKILFYQLMKQNMDEFYTKKFYFSYLHDPLTFSSAVFETVDFEQQSILFKENGEFSIATTGKPQIISTAVHYDRFWKDFSRKCMTE